jgi:membrane protease YdiL (CAAX protease family)
MTQILVNVRATFATWFRATRNHVLMTRRSRALPIWIAIAFVAFDFLFLGYWYRHSDQSSVGTYIISAASQFCMRFVLIIATLAVACRCFGVSREAIGIRTSNLVSDLRWSITWCFVGMFIIGIAAAMAMAGAVILGVHLPAPPAWIAQFLGGKWDLRYLILLATLGTAGNLLVAATEELIYRTLFLPPLTSRLGLFPAIALTSIVFGFAHVIPFGIIAVPVPQIVGGILMATGFAIRWSVAPAIVIHAMGNGFAGLIALVYVRMFQAHPSWFFSK